jgi:hypothetical protein
MGRDAVLTFCACGDEVFVFDFLGLGEFLEWDEATCGEAEFGGAAEERGGIDWIDEFDEEDLHVDGVPAFLGADPFGATGFAFADRVGVALFGESGVETSDFGVDAIVHADDFFAGFEHGVGRVGSCEGVESESAVGGFEMGGFAESGGSVEEPCGGPVEHVGEGGGRGAEAGVAAAGVVEPRGGMFRAGEVD